MSTRKKRKNNLRGKIKNARKKKIGTNINNILRLSSLFRRTITDNQNASARTFTHINSKFNYYLWQFRFCFCFGRSMVLYNSETVFRLFFFCFRLLFHLFLIFFLFVSHYFTLSADCLCVSAIQRAAHSIKYLLFVLGSRVAVENDSKILYFIFEFRVSIPIKRKYYSV